MGMKDGRSSDLKLTWLTQTHGSEWEEWRELAAQWLEEQDSNLTGKTARIVSGAPKK